MTTRTAQCACGRVQVTAHEEPGIIVICHCDFCQKRSGSVLPVQAYFDDPTRVDISGETKIYNGLQVDGAATVTGLEVEYHFCTTCGSTIYWVLHGRKGLKIGIAVGNFVDPNFPQPTSEYNANLRHDWLPALPVAERFEEF